MAEVKVVKASEIDDKSSLYPAQSDSARANGSSLNNPVRTAKQEREKLEPAVQRSKMRHRSIVGERVKDMAETIWHDILEPALQYTIVDMFQSAVEIAVYGEATGRRSRNKKGHIDFGSQYRGNSNNDLRRARERDRDRGRRSIDEYENITYDSKDEAKDVVWKMRDRADKYDVVTILDLYDFSNMSARDPECDRFGWDFDDMCNVSVASYYDRNERETRWYINFPKYHQV